MVMGGGWVIDLDIQSFFDVLDHSHLRGFLDQRVRDGVLRRTIDKWLKAGVLEDGRLRRSVLGTPQGGVVSPLLANIYLHYVLDVWFTTEVQPRLRGRSVLVRYADDVVIVVERESDVHRVLDVLPKRLGRFGLTMQPEKSRLVRFVRPRFGWLGTASTARASQLRRSAPVGYQYSADADSAHFASGGQGELRSASWTWRVPPEKVILVYHARARRDCRNIRPSEDDAERVSLWPGRQSRGARGGR